MTNTLEIVKKLKTASDAYYNTGEIQMTDAEYDKLRGELVRLDPNNPFLKEVGAPATEMFAKVKHTIPMGSLNKSADIEEFNDWYAKTSSEPLCVMHKLDGSSIEIIYKNGKFIQAISRGNGIFGEDLSHNVKRFKNVSLTLTEPFSGSVRGEAILSIKDFKNLFKDMANPRNAANGCVRQKTDTRSEHLQFIAYDICNGKKFSTHDEKLEFIRKLGLDVVKYDILDRDGALKLYDKIADERKNLDFEIDGVVFRVNSEQIFNEMGERDNRPKGATVLKFEAEQGITTLESVELSIGHGGAIIPVGKLKPVQIGGVMVSSVLLNNFEETERLGLAIGDELVIIRAGDVIPKAISVHKRGLNRKPILPPVSCPFCGSKLEKDGAHIFCRNEECEGRRDSLLKTWLRKRDIKFIGDALRNHLFSIGIDTPSKLYTLTERSLASMPIGDGVVGTNSVRIMAELEKSRTSTLTDFVGSLGIKFLGRRQAEIMGEIGIDTLDKFLNLKSDELATKPGFSTTKAEGIVQGIKKMRPEIDALLKVIKISEKEEPKMSSSTGGKLEGNSFCFSGGLPSGMVRAEAQELVRTNGGIVKESVVSGLNYLVLADPNSTSSKANKARKLGVKIISEEEFQRMII